jgi:hypothetical protein
MKDLRTKIIENGIKNLNEFGYPEVNKEDILTDIVYSQFFKSMLEENLGYSNQMDLVLSNLIGDIKQQ